jgi:hypothetical protein
MLLLTPSRLLLAGVVTIAACDNHKDGAEVGASPSQEGVSKEHTPAKGPVRFVLNQEAVQFLPSISIDTWVPLRTLVTAAPPKSWLRVEAKSKAGTILAISLDKYPNHHPCLIRGADKHWSLGWYRGSDECTDADSVLSIKELREVHIWTEVLKREASSERLRLVWGKRLQWIDAKSLERPSPALVSETHSGKNGKGSGKRKSKGNRGVTLPALLMLHGRIDAISSIAVVDASGNPHEIPSEFWNNEGTAPARVKRNRKGEYSIRWQSPDGKLIRIDSPQEIRIQP